MVKTILRLGLIAEEGKEAEGVSKFAEHFILPTVFPSSFSSDVHEKIRFQTLTVYLFHLHLVTRRFFNFKSSWKRDFWKGNLDKISVGLFTR